MTSRTFPPGQLAVKGFPRFGRDLGAPPPQLPPSHTIEVSGPLDGPLSLTLTDLADIGEVEREENFHCVAGWSATGLRWTGVPFAEVYHKLIAPRLNGEPTITHLTFRGYDDHTAILRLADALADDALLATGLHGKPLTAEHGAPVRLVSPRQYGYMNTKHLSEIGLHTRKPRETGDVLTRYILPSHDRARVWEEERHPWFPSLVVRPIYHRIMRMAARRGRWEFTD